MKTSNCKKMISLIMCVAMILSMVACGQKATPATPAAPAASVAPAAPETDDAAVVAAIVAAISAYTGKAPAGFRVVSFRKKH